MKRTVMLIILDGWGLGPATGSNPVHVVGPKNFEWLAQNFPMTSLQASGISVGLPWGEVGNSEVGHLTLGAGKVIYQYFPRITMAIRDQSFFENPVLKNAFSHAKKNNSAVNIIGLLGSGTVHSSIEHLEALLKMAERENVSNIKLHLFGDGRDSPPRTLEKLLEKIPQEKVATLAGRYYAMNRDQNWMLTERTYGCLAATSGQVVESIAEAKKVIENSYRQGLSEEFLLPLRIGANAIRDNDAVIFFNYREDSMRQLSRAFISQNFDKFPVKRFKNLYIATMTLYEETSTAGAAFPPETVEQPLSRVLSETGKTQLKIAETFKYAHVTYFFNGYRDPPFENEYRVLIPSLKIAHPDEQPELMAGAITDRLLEVVQNQSFDFALANYSNPDVIAHTGNYNACLEAVRVIDAEIGRLIKTALGTPTVVLITSDHGNIEEVVNPQTGQPETQHDPSPVPFYLIGSEFKKRKFLNWQNIGTETIGIISDVAPTILELMRIPKPKEMTGRSLLENLI